MNPVGDTAGAGIVGVLRRMDALGADVHAGLASQVHFLGTYRRTTVAVGEALADGRFEDPHWVDRWDAAFADFYLHAVRASLAGEPVPLPWRLAFAAPRQLPPPRHLLLGMNAHINYDLPQALLAVISDADFADPAVLAQRRRDHERIDEVLASRVGAEGEAITAGMHMRVLDRLLRPANRHSTVLFLRRARRKVWHNTAALQRARVAGPEAYATRLTELEQLTAARITDLLAPGQVFLRLAVVGFGVTLPGD